MKLFKNLNYTILSLSMVIFIGCSEKESWTPLLDSNLTNWDTYLSYRHQIGYTGDAPTDEAGNLIAPIGLNNNESNVFTTIIENNDTILRVSGEIYGCLISKKVYENYHLRLQVKWGDTKWIPRKDKLKDSGILYHSIGEPGAEYWRSWMLSQEFQVMEGHMGDYWSQATSAIDIRAYPPESAMSAVANTTQPFIAMGEGEEIFGFCMRYEDREQPPGEWNTLELICHEGKSVHIVNGEVVMVLKNSRYIDQGQVLPLTQGKIQLQSEAAEVFYKAIEIRELETLPKKYAALFK